MYYNIYEVDSVPIAHSLMDAGSIGEHVVFISKCAVVDDVEKREDALKEFGKWLEQENLGVLKKSAFILNEDAATGKHFANRYAKFHRLAEEIAGITEEDYCRRFHDIRNLTSDIQKAVVNEDDDYVLLAGTLFTMDEFLRFAKPGITYYIGSICKYHC